MLPKGLFSASLTLLTFIAVVQPTVRGPRVDAGSADWWKHAVFYQIYPRSFKDFDNNGVGDLQGIIRKLGHLKDAGVTAAWLSPIYKSPQVDHGYDISDFKDIDPQFGTMSDFDDLITKAHKLGIKIVMDFVPNHSSNKHEWFERSEKRQVGYEDFYVWKDAVNGKAPNNWISIFKNSAWNYSEVRGQYYLHQFAPEQPDLNYRNADLLQDMTDVLQFWLDKGVDGFRMDAVPYLVEHPDFNDEPLSGDPSAKPSDYGYLKHIYTSDQQGTFDIIYKWRQFLEDYTTEHGGDARVMMTEAYTDIENTMRYYGDGEHEGAHFTFNFQLITKLNKDSNARDIVGAINEWITYMPPQYTANWVLGNHDQHRAATKFGPENVDGFNMLAAFLPGVQVTYNGEEIGQENGEVTYEQGQDPSACSVDEEYFDSISRDFQRTPFHWDDSINAGFNYGAEPWLPVSVKYKKTNLKLQSVPGVRSHYHIYQELLKLRQEPAFVNGKLNIAAISDNVLAFTREIDNGVPYVVVFNVGGQKETVDLSRFSVLKKNIKVVAADVNSKKQDRVLSTSNIQLAAHESIVAKAIPDVEIKDLDWWKNAVFYQIYPRSFKDASNDGKGDLQGIISKLGHLKDAGITAAWLSPIYKSPQVDHGYDISDFKDIDPDYGTMDDFDNLITEAHKLGIKIVMDFVPNHSSDQHEWFEKSEKREPGFEDFYVWRDGFGRDPPNNWLSRFKYSAWNYSEIRQQHYLHQFAPEQPDLNYRSPLLVQNMKDVLKFWLDRGVDGFRMDAVPYLFEDAYFRDEPLSGIPDIDPNDYFYLKHIYTSDLHETFDMIYQWRELLEDYTQEHGGDARVMMTEVYTDIKNTMLYYGNEEREGAHFTFNFQLITDVNQSSNARDIVAAVNTWMDNMPVKYTANWVLGNHDNPRVATRFGPENVDGFNMFISMLPGVMVTYNGEEIGQENGEVTWEQGEDPSACNGKEEDFNITSRDFERTPFHWDDSVNAGFNGGAKPWLPVSEKYLKTNLKAQSDVKVLSHYQLYKKLIQLRKEPTARGGKLDIKALSNNVLAYIRTLEGSDTYVFVFNVGSKSETVNLNSAFSSLVTYLSVELPSGQSSYQHGDIVDPRMLTLEAHESIIAVATDEAVTGSIETTTATASAISITFIMLSTALICVNLFK